MVTGWIRAASALCGVDEPFRGLGKGGLVAVIVISVLTIVTFVWIFRETGRRE